MAVTGLNTLVIGMHALHVVVAVGVLAAVLWRDRRSRFPRARLVDVAVGHLY